MDVLNDILDSLNDSIIIIDPYGQVVFYNKEALLIQKSFSNKPVEIGDQMPDVVNAEHRQGITAILKLVRTYKRPYATYAECHTHTGSRICLELKFIPILEKTGRIKFINIITVDITARKVLENRARAASLDVSHLLEHAHALILSVDVRGYIVECNKHFSDVTGFEKNDIYCQKVSEVLVSQSESSLIDQLMQRALMNESITNFRLTLQRKSGSELIGVFSASPRLNLQGEVIGATWIGQDVTELSAYRNALHPFIPVDTKDRSKRRNVFKIGGAHARMSSVVRLTIEFFQKALLHERWQAKSSSVAESLPSTKAV